MTIYPLSIHSYRLSLSICRLLRLTFKLSNFRGFNFHDVVVVVVFDGVDDDDCISVSLSIFELRIDGVTIDGLRNDVVRV